MKQLNRLLSHLEPTLSRKNNVTHKSAGRVVREDHIQHPYLEKDEIVTNINK